MHRQSMESQTFDSTRPNSSSRLPWGIPANRTVERDIDIAVGGSNFIGYIVEGEVVGRREGVEGVLVVTGMLVATGAA